jgi:hypothetical protein
LRRLRLIGANAILFALLVAFLTLFAAFIDEIARAVI